MIIEVKKEPRNREGYSKQRREHQRGIRNKRSHEPPISHVESADLLAVCEAIQIIINLECDDMVER